MSIIPRPRPMGRVDYTSTNPPSEYHCGNCGDIGVKLWRDYNTLLEQQSLLCGDCACREQSTTCGRNLSIHESQIKPGHVDIRSDPDPYAIYSGGDQIGWRVPAVPTEDGKTYWGYTSVPEAGCNWWYSLPLRKKIA